MTNHYANKCSQELYDKTQKKIREYTDCEKFVNDHLTYINRNAGYIEYVDKNGNNVEAGFADNPMDAIRSAAKLVAKQRVIVY